MQAGSLKLASSSRAEFESGHARYFRLSIGEDLAAEYLRTYWQWRTAFGLLDPCIDELRSAILAECDRDALSVLQRDRLECLERLIRREQELAAETLQ